MANYFNSLADIGDDDLGSLGLFRRRKRRARGGRSMPARMLVPGVPGVPSRGLREQPLPLGATSFTASSGTSLQLAANNVSRPFRGRRLIIDVVKTGTTGGLVSITSLNVGADNQLPVPAGTAMPAAAFQSTAVGVNLDMDPAGPGVGVTAQLQISAAPQMTDTVDCSGVIIGSTVG